MRRGCFAYDRPSAQVTTGLCGWATTSNPVLVVVNPRLNKAVVDAVEQAAEQFSTSGAIDGWVRADRRAQADLARRMQGVPKRYVFAEPDGTGLPIKSLLQDAKANSATVPVRRYFDAGEQR